MASALADRDGALNALFELGAAGISEVDLRSGRFIRVNGRFCEMMRRDAATLLALRPSDVIHPDDVEAADSALRSAALGSGRWEGEVRHIGPDGEVIWVRLGMAVWNWDADGAPLRCVAVLQDITESRVAAEQLRRASELMRLSQEIGKIGSFSHDFAAGLVHLNAQARQLFGLPPGEGPVPADLWKEIMLPEDRDRGAAIIAEAIGRRAPETGRDWRVFDPTRNAIRHLETRARLFYEPDGRPREAIGVVIDVTARKAAEERLAHAAKHDALTGLANRALFRERIEEALASASLGKRFAVLYLDLDRFKHVNDTFGHPIGDELLAALGRRIKSELRQADLLARLGGDEFAILQYDVERPDASASVARRLIERVSEPFLIGGHAISVGVSIGIALAPGDGAQYEMLMKAADVALYQAKAEGRSRWRFFETDMNRREQRRRALESDLCRALADGEFEIHYQPIVHVETLRIRGFEALARWRHPLRGLVSPEEFIPICEDIGLIAPLGAWVLRQACAEAARWPEPLRIAVNLSPPQFATGGLEADVAAALGESGLPAERLEFEITETVLLHDSPATLATLQKLKSLGVRIAMDDFGSGYSSLGYLQRFPFDKVKIDRAFTQALGASKRSRAIVQAILDLCAGLQITTTCEGVETAEQREFLKSRGCDEAQGYLFGAPMPASEAARLLERQSQSGWGQAA